MVHKNSISDDLRTTSLSDEDGISVLTLQNYCSFSSKCKQRQILNNYGLLLKVDRNTSPLKCKPVSNEGQLLSAVEIRNICEFTVSKCKAAR